MKTLVSEGVTGRAVKLMSTNTGSNVTVHAMPSNRKRVGVPRVVPGKHVLPDDLHCVVDDEKRR
jgi:hypothetical protein